IRNVVSLPGRAHAVYLYLSASIYPVQKVIVILFDHHFFFYSSGAHLDLHSFPTRRSSDLLSAMRPVLKRGENEISDYEAVLGVRSEEHTSELQSRFDLVCRLLLEKKKILHK